MILLTLPGERIMVPNFGVGIQRFLFELENSNISATLTGLIQEQISNYLPPVTVLDISTNMDEEEANMLRVKISYDIDFLNARDTLDLLLDDYR